MVKNSIKEMEELRNLMDQEENLLESENLRNLTKEDLIKELQEKNNLLLNLQNDKEEIKKMNIYEKLVKARVEVQQTPMTKTGFNKYTNFKYFELADFLPVILEKCFINRIASIYHFNKEEATLKIINIDNPQEEIIFRTDIAIAEISNASFMQKLGGTQTYSRRYLYQMAFEVSENDLLNQAEIDTKKEEEIQEGKQKIAPVYINSITKLLKETNTDIEKFLNKVGFDRIEDITNDRIPGIMQDFNKKKKLLADAKKIIEETNKLTGDKPGDFEF